MSVSPGTRLGPYEILAPLGAGGMGEVYRATDTRLKRQVAVKVRVQTQPAFSVSAPEPLAAVPFFGARLGQRNVGGEFEVSPDDQRFLVLRAEGAAAPPALNVVLNWASDVARRVTGK